MFHHSTQFADWLMWFIKDSESVTALTRPFQLANGMRCATDGVFAVATTEPGDVMPIQEKATMQTQRFPQTVVDLLNEETAQCVEMTFAAAAAMFGPLDMPKIETCPDCYGTGEVQHNCGCELCEADTEDCDVCGGVGKIEEELPNRYVRCWGKPFDAKRIAYIFGHAPACESCVWLKLHIKDAAARLHIVTQQWHAILVGLQVEIKNEKDYPEVVAVCERVG